MPNNNKLYKLFLRKKTTTQKITSLQCTDYLYMGFRIMGVYMPEHHKIPYIIYILLVNGLGTVYQMIVFTMVFFEIPDENTEMGRWLTSFQVGIAVYACAAKSIIIAFMIKKLRVADAVMEQLDARCQQEDEIAELYKLSRLTKKIATFFAVVYWSYVTCTALAAVIFGHPPYAVYLPYIDWRNSRLEFWAASLIEYIRMAFAGFQQFCCDSYGVIYVCILRAHMQILLLRVSKLGVDKEKSAEQHIHDLKLCVKDHKMIMQLFNIITPAISLTIFAQFMVTAAIIGVTLINIFIFAADTASIVASCVYIFAVCCETFPLCYFAQHLISDSEKLTDAIFHSHWVELGPKYGKMLAFFMKSTQISMEMMAGKLIPITLNSFVNIAKLSFSLFTFIRKMDINKRIDQGK